MLRAKVDYLEWTVPFDKLYEVLRLFPGFEPLERGWRGYVSSALVAGGKGRVGWHEDRPDMGVHCSLGSQGLAVLAGLDDRWADLPSMLKVLREDMGGHVTRLDVAWDDKTGHLDLDVMEEAVRQGHFTSRWKGGYRRWGWGNQAGETLYFGSRSSDAMLRAYDKRAERLAKGHAEEVEGVDHWVRVELQLRRKRADKAGEWFQGVKDKAEEVFEDLAGVLRGYLEFKTPNPHDSNKRRWAPAEWWLTFLGDVKKTRLVVEAEVKTIANVMNWLSVSVAPSLALVEEALGKDEAWAFLFSEASAGRLRWKAKHRSILEETRLQRARLAGVAV